MRVIVVRHHDVDTAGFIADAFVARGAELAVHLFPGDGPLPALDGVSHVVILGAVWSVYDTATIGGWIGDELAWVRQADEAGIPVLGICFGAQVLAAALGGEVHDIGRNEIGWTTVESLDPALVPEGPWLEFHHDTCVLPPGARLLARNETGAQAFAIRRNLAVQFHPEVDAAQLRRWLAGGSKADVIQAGLDPTALVTQTRAQQAAAARRADHLVEMALHLDTVTA
ncbi:MAG TPA: type 1 glutamine amidotransferase [Streptosporangiaceae bacterium]